MWYTALRDVQPYIQWPVVLCVALIGALWDIATRRIPNGLTAPVILAGAVLAEAALETVGFDTITVSEKDLLDGLAVEVVRGL